eukprot:CAMPEP_0201536194 /NCGR_PEP_ID=MMETSP0161_2-20130828/61220_1 /ASSEMBLY_ACC=CAM_ASM_000251 /TAXON_ID=180227 /ORGANISM="Neoparamoeba aestuarina, Strain SoJaBio B1-5/56/2" /LENGTH=71 /DNA_ID=CAMNT_0047941765 /DNA_START=63 /DNA_END=278 /DNA_ORIENTATION=-
MTSTSLLVNRNLALSGVGTEWRVKEETFRIYQANSPHKSKYQANNEELEPVGHSFESQYEGETFLLNFEIV